jgi:hypothetical protein
MALVSPSVHQCKASFFDRDLCFGCDPVGAMHSYCCELEEGLQLLAIQHAILRTREPS